MKKLAWLLAFTLLLAGCDQPAPPASGPASSAPASTAGGVSQPSEESQPAEEPEAAPPSSATMAQQAPKPEGLPQAQQGALELPGQLAEAQEGYGLELLTPAQYDATLDSGKGGPRQYLTGAVFVLGLGDGLGEERFAVANPNGKLVTDFVYDGSQDGYWTAYGGWIAMRKDGESGLVDAADGTELLPFEYDTITGVFLGEDTWSDQLVEARKGDETLILAPRTGETVFTLERGDEFYALSDRYVALQDGMLRIYDESFQPVANFVCDRVQLNRGDPADFGDLLGVECNGLWGLTDLEGNFIVNPIYEELGYFQGDYAAVKKDGLWGVINYRGEVVVPLEWEDLILQEDSASVSRSGRWGAITDLDSGELEVPLVYSFVYGFGENGYACFERDGRYGLLDREGNEMLSASYDAPIDTNANLESGYFLVEGDGPLQGAVIGRGGQVLISDDHMFLSGAEGEPYNMVCTPRGKWGYVDRAGQYVIDAKYDNAGPFMPGREVAIVTLDGKVQLIDRQGNPVLSTVFSDIVGYNPETMVCAMEYTAPTGESRVCLARMILPEG